MNPRTDTAVPLPQQEPELRATAPAELVRLNNRTVGTPLVLVHDVAGTVTHLKGLAQELSCPVFGLQAREPAPAGAPVSLTDPMRQGSHHALTSLLNNNHRSSSPVCAQMSLAALACANTGSMDALAAHYLKALESLALPKDGFVLGGSGFGARVAHAMAVLQNNAVKSASQPAEVKAATAAAFAAAGPGGSGSASASGSAEVPHPSQGVDLAQQATRRSRLSGLALRITPRKLTPPQAQRPPLPPKSGSVRGQASTSAQPAQQQPTPPAPPAPAALAAPMASGQRNPVPVVSLVLLDAPLGRPVDPPLRPGVWGLYCAAWEAMVRYGPAPAPAGSPPGTPGPELSVEIFNAGISARESPDEQLDFTAQFRPEDMSQAEWDRTVDKVLNCVHACSLLAAKPRAMQPSAAVPGLYDGPCVLLFTDAGERQHVVTAVKRVCPAVEAEHIPQSADLMDPSTLPQTLAALCRLVPRVKPPPPRQAGSSGGSNQNSARSTASQSPREADGAASAKKAVIPGGRREG